MTATARAGRRGALAALTDGLGLDRDYVVSLEGLLPATRFAVDAYVAFVRDRSRAGGDRLLADRDVLAQHHLQRVSGMLRNYDFVTPETLAYFTPRLTQAPQDVAFALDYVKRMPRTREEQEQVLAALRFKCDLLWAQLDALHFAYVDAAAPAPFARDGTKPPSRAWRAA
jgi:pyrroloquinoline-quinone synthase